MTNTVLKTKNLTKKYGSHLAVDNANLEIKQGEIFGLVGKNGAGKTTLLRMIIGLNMPTSGDMELFNETALGTGSGNYGKPRFTYP